jgi:hypothetical protein
MKTHEVHGASRRTMWLGGWAGPLPNDWTAANGEDATAILEHRISYRLRIIQGGAGRVGDSPVSCAIVAGLKNVVDDPVDVASKTEIVVCRRHDSANCYCTVFVLLCSVCRTGNCGPFRAVSQDFARRTAGQAPLSDDTKSTRLLLLIAAEGRNRCLRI